MAPAPPVDLRAILKYAHKIAYTSFAPLGHDPAQPLPQHFRPPNPQEWQLRASQLHQFQGQTVHNCIDFAAGMSLFELLHCAWQANRLCSHAIDIIWLMKCHMVVAIGHTVLYSSPSISFRTSPCLDSMWSLLKRALGGQAKLAAYNAK